MESREHGVGGSIQSLLRSIAGLIFWGFLLYLLFQCTFSEDVSDTPRESARPAGFLHNKYGKGTGLMYVTESTRGCRSRMQYQDWLACLREGEHLNEGQVVYVLNDGTADEGALVRMRNGAREYGPILVVPPNRLRPVGQ